MYQFLVWQFLDPYTLLMLLLGIGVLRLWWRRQERRGRLLWVTGPYVVLLLMSLPVTADYALGSLEWRTTPLLKKPADAQAIVVLASYVHPPTTPGDLPELDEGTANRCLKAAELYRNGASCPVLASGGSEDPKEAPVCAEVMRDLLIRLGVRPADVIVEGSSQTTYENAALSANLLKERGLSRVVLVTDAYHLVRSARCFRKQGIDVVPCGCGYRAEWLDFRFSKFLPRISAVHACQHAFHEWLGLAWYWLRGRV